MTCPEEAGLETGSGVLDLGLGQECGEWESVLGAGTSWNLTVVMAVPTANRLSPTESYTPKVGL